MPPRTVAIRRCTPQRSPRTSHPRRTPAHPTPRSASTVSDIATQPAAGPAWDPNRSHIKVSLRGLRTEAQLGLHPWERHPERPTRLVVNIDMMAPTVGTACPYINYDPIRSAVRAWPSRPHTDLLETLAEELVALCFSLEAVQACRVSVEKPDIFNEADAAAVEIFRVRSIGS